MYYALRLLIRINKIEGNKLKKQESKNNKINFVEFYGEYFPFKYMIIGARATSLNGKINIGIH